MSIGPLPYQILCTVLCRIRVVNMSDRPFLKRQPLPFPRTESFVPYLEGDDVCMYVLLLQVPKSIENENAQYQSAANKVKSGSGILLTD